MRHLLLVTDCRSVPDLTNVCVFCIKVFVTGSDIYCSRLDWAAQDLGLPTHRTAMSFRHLSGL